MWSFGVLILFLLQGYILIKDLIPIPKSILFVLGGIEAGALAGISVLTSFPTQDDSLLWHCVGIGLCILAAIIGGITCVLLQGYKTPLINKIKKQTNIDTNKSFQLDTSFISKGGSEINKWTHFNSILSKKSNQNQSQQSDVDSLNEEFATFHPNLSTSSNISTISKSGNNTFNEKLSSNKKSRSPYHFEFDKDKIDPNNIDPYNLYDPTELPSHFLEYVDEVSKSAQELGDCFGFQVDSVRNQAEHCLILIANHRRYASKLPELVSLPSYSSPIDVLHSRLFVNYRKWCKYLHITPYFRSKYLPKYTQAYTEALVTDILLYLCIWGEAGNIRHMPECLCFLFHKMMKEYVTYTKNKNIRPPLPPGYYLDEVITPIYKKIKNNTKKSGDHVNRLNYDDFNEFFWHRDCLKYHYANTVVMPLFDNMKKKNIENDIENDDDLDQDEEDALLWPSAINSQNHLNVSKSGYSSFSRASPTMNKHKLNKKMKRKKKKRQKNNHNDSIANNLNKVKFSKSKSISSEQLFEIPIAIALESIGKSFLEKRSPWNVLNKLRRLVEFMCISFYTSFVIGLDSELNWANSFLVQVISINFVLINGLSIVWLILDIYLHLPNVYLHWTICYGFVVKLAFCYLVFVYQLIFLYRSFQYHYTKTTASSEVIYTVSYWWWQYIYISTIPMLYYLWCCIKQLIPTQKIANIQLNNRFIMACKDVFWPKSHLYVSNEMPETWHNIIRYNIFWITLFLCKLPVSFYLEILPVVPSTISCYDAYFNASNNESLTLVLTQVVLYVFPHFLVFFLDISIWYAIWSGFVGIYLGVKINLGEIIEFQDIQDHFMELPDKCFNKILTDEKDEIDIKTYQNISFKEEAKKNKKKKNKQITENDNDKNTNDIDNDRIIKTMLLMKDDNDDVLYRPNKVTSYGTDLKNKLNLESLVDDDIEDENFYNNNYTRQGIEYTKSKLNNSGITIPSIISDRTIKEWFAFSVIWNEIIYRLRYSDLISNQEELNLEFHFFSFLEYKLYLPSLETSGEVLRGLEICISLAEHVREEILRRIEYEKDQPSFFSPKNVNYNEGTQETLNADNDTEINDDGGTFTTVNSFLSMGVSSLKPTYPFDLKQKTKDSSSTKSRTNQVISYPLNGSPIMGDNLPADFPLHVKDQIYKKLIKEKSIIISVKETWELSKYFFYKILGLRHQSNIKSILEAITIWIDSDRVVDRINFTTALMNFFQDYQKIVGVLAKLLKKRKNDEEMQQYNNEYMNNKSKLNISSSIKKSISTNSLPTTLKKKSPTESKLEAFDKYDNIEVFDPLRDKLRDDLRTFFDKIKEIFRVPTSEHSRLITDTLILIQSNNKGFFWHDVYASITLNDLSNDDNFLSVLNKLHGLLCLEKDAAQPRSVEARRRLSFFSNSLLMQIPNAPTISNMKSWSILTPYYSEDVIISRDDILKKNDEHISTLLYLKTLFKNEWKNFLERLGVKDDRDIMDTYLMEVRLWASMRSQTLFRTVEGMMFNEDALRLLWFIEKRKESNETEFNIGNLKVSKYNNQNIDKDNDNNEKKDDKKKTLFETDILLSPSFNRTNRNEINLDWDISEGYHKEWGIFSEHEKKKLENTIKEKFTYVVSAQVYGDMKKKGDPKVEDINFLLRRYKNLRIAYIDRKRIREGDLKYYSVLIKWNDLKGTTEEIYRILLPGQPILGEGKPENQNHSVVFTRGELLQAIDMNQEGYFEETLKSRNLLQEFEFGDIKPTILGFREHIFTGSVSTLAKYMAMQEFSFVTLGQRVLNYPLRIRLHYGHPDIFDKIFFLTRGGVSKASKGINLSEDIFAGYNNMLRGGTVQFKEYHQVGKGRDVGVQQIYKFEAKLAQGAAEQTLSRDLDRFYNQLDFARLLSTYYGGMGHFINSVITMFSIKFIAYIVCLFAVYNAESIGGRLPAPISSIQAIFAILGLLQTFPLFCSLFVEQGVIKALSVTFEILFTGGPLHYIFHIQTRSHYFLQTFIFGGAQYRGTGRGFAIFHNSFSKTFRFFATSHFYLGFELIMALLLFHFNTQLEDKWSRTWALWLTTISLIFSPFWFNPASLEWNKVVDDYYEWSGWMFSSGGNADNSWKIWWKDETNGYHKLNWDRKIMILTRRLILYCLIAYGIITETATYENIWLHLLKILMIIIGSMIGFIILEKTKKMMTYPFRRLLNISLCIIITITLCLLFYFHSIYLKTIIAFYYISAGLAMFILLYNISKHIIWVYWLHDLVIGHSLFLILFILAMLQIPAMIQMWVLFHDALSKGVVLRELLEGHGKTENTLSLNRNKLSNRYMKKKGYTPISDKKKGEDENQPFPDFSTIHGHFTPRNNGYQSSMLFDLSPIMIDEEQIQPNINENKSIENDDDDIFETSNF